MQPVKVTLKLAAAVALVALTGGPTRAASHSDAPLIKQDPQANLTDVYAFIGTKSGNPRVKVLNVIVHVRPFSEPGDGPTYDRFADDALYTIHLNHPATGVPLARYDFRFSPVFSGYKNLDTILSYGRGTEIGPIQNIGDARQNYSQTYSVTHTRGDETTLIADGLLVPPPNAGKRVTPFYNDANGQAVSGAATFAALDRYTRQAVVRTRSGEVFFCGQREDGFFADVPGIFDLLDGRILGDSLGQRGPGVDGFKGFNVLAYALQIPVDQLTDLPGFPTLGVYASVSRQRMTLRNTDGPPEHSGPWVRVNRMGNPLFNEVLVALRDKDNYNRTFPTDDATRFRTYALQPEVIVLLNTVFGQNFQTNNRTDLAGIYIPDLLRVNASTEPVRLSGQPGFSRLSFIGMDTTKDGVPSGWPNGRRLGDDVVDIALTAIASGPDFTTITVVGDNVIANDQAYHLVFPYSATPHAGTNNRKDPVMQ